MKVLMILPSLSGNTMVRPYAFYNMLIDNGHEVFFAGFINKKKREIYGPYKDLINFHEIDTSSFSSLYAGLKKLKQLAKKVDVIHSTTSLFISNFPAWVLSKYFNKPLVIDIFDLDFNPKNFIQKINFNTIGQWIVKNNKNNMVHSSVLQKIYGGKIIRTGTDTELYSPDVIGVKALRKKLGLEGKIVISFLGSPRRYKGAELILRSIDLLKNDKIVFLIVGSTDDAHFQQLYPKFKKFVKILAPQPFTDMPKYLSMTDVVILPQFNYGPWCIAQVPAKLYDSMAAAKPIIISDVGDMPSILGDCGLIINGNFESTSPGNKEINSLSKKIDWVINHKEEAKELGKKARIRCVKNYSRAVLCNKLLQVYSKCLRG